MSDLTFRVKVGDSWRTVAERDFLIEVTALQERGFAGLTPGPITIEAVDERGRVCWRAYYKGFRALARELTQENKRTRKP